MAKKISANVGKGCKNNPQDVSVIRDLLISHKQWLAPFVIKTTGAYNKELSNAIEIFQKRACALKKPNGRIEPHSFTLARLNMSKIPRPMHPVFNLSYNINTHSLKDSDYHKVALLLQCDVEAIKAVAEVETKESAWDHMGRPKILFEPHYFRQLTQDKYSKTHPDISGPYSPDSYEGSRLQYPKLYRAAVLDQQAALKSTAWGRFQIMGAHYKQAGYSSVSVFVQDMMISEYMHLNTFANFIKNDKNLLIAIQEKNWEAFARCYNGPSYAQSKYDIRIDAAYKRFRAMNKPSPASID